MGWHQLVSDPNKSSCVSTLGTSLSNSDSVFCICLPLEIKLSLLLISKLEKLQLLNCHLSRKHGPRLPQHSDVPICLTFNIPPSPSMLTPSELPLRSQNSPSCCFAALRTTVCWYSEARGWVPARLVPAVENEAACYCSVVYVPLTENTHTETSVV